MRVFTIALAAAAALAWQAAPSMGQPAPASRQAAQSDDTIVVTGERMRTILRDFVADISATPSDENQIARWDRRVCTGVFGMTHRDQAQFIADRIAQRAFAVGLDAGATGCRANIVIFVTPDANALSHTLATEYRNLLAVRHDFNTHTRGLDALDSFATSSRPVRWWHVSDTVSQDGIHLNTASGNMAMSMGAQIRVFDPSRLRRTVRQDFSRVILVVDARQAAGHRLDALADYLAMVSLAQLAPTVETAAYPSVLNLFTNDSSVSGMTSWDIAYLDGLYHAPRNANSAREQEGRIADRMNRTLNDQEAPAPSQPSP